LTNTICGLATSNYDAAFEATPLVTHPSMNPVEIGTLAQYPSDPASGLGCGPRTL